MSVRGHSTFACRARTVTIPASIATGRLPVLRETITIRVPGSTATPRHPRETTEQDVPLAWEPLVGRTVQGSVPEDLEIVEEDRILDQGGIEMLGWILCQPLPELPGIMGPVSEPEQLVRAVAAEGVGDPRVLDAVRAVPRAGFVPPYLTGRAYEDRPLPIPHDQVTTQPSLVAKMVEALGLAGSERVLEVGAGYGWQTALLARVCGFVWAVERFADVAEAARANLARFGVANAEVVEGDGTEGLSEHAPYDAILVAAAFPSVPRPLEEQLAAGGRLVQPVGPGGAEEVVLFEKGPRNLERLQVVAWASFVRLHGAHAFPEE